ncbi:diaminohydroxyphosphoribosylaminopyrimidine deaminase/5-amino-6-(5-phosphoribosylamino)uracil reductase [Streptomonospora nanhaiensis]|uniref:diaminohydroxyphosphoribosylaminopyrimidine deaminase n=2 Tax=Streptomonospora nanhaiensis TaxID=1323731 RepID=A0A853BP83_9ACTN|nr:bifunctional diaminohydroxyphosphoribosylaminopyrimidine deaminase/5-amino-6-(5-phosphoribosylamino)uracil reductase RibD [Streptomonospora nanhaiensis]NYI96983.1 diaminohydroxyphosphoribosylaminopyrimidine deaminase/5-amino-6-(5-phosphoribosylamino)uracil reductase [Streptomonospora nanhaiensis]
MATPAEAAAMRRAIALSAHGLGTTAPNPPVGCVILDESGEIVGQGYHQRKGESHAETIALAQAGERARGATAVVTLEPCNHAGRTPPCRQALLDAGIARVLIALLDPTSREEGGAARLRAAGVDVEVGVLADEAGLVLGPWMTTLRTRRPVLWWTCVLGPHGLAEADLSHLLARMDAVLYADGRVREAVPGSHGEGILHLPGRVDPAAPDAALRALFDGGARTVLFRGGRSQADPFLRAGMIDHITVVLPVEVGGLATGELLPTGYSIDALTRDSDAVVIHAARRPAPTEEDS